MDETIEQARAMLDRAEQIYGPEELAEVYDRMAAQIEGALADSDPVVLCVMMGGLIPAAEITKRLRFAFEFDYLHATRYRGETEGGELVWKVSPGIPLAGRHVLVIDDILDEGTTLESILRAIESQGAESIRTAILLQKRHSRRDPALQVDFPGLEVPDRYVFGAGMDYLGYFRQLPAVYAVPDEEA